MDTLGILNQQLLHLGQSLIVLLPGLALALVILGLTAILARSATGLSEKLAARTDMRADLKNLARTVIRLAIWVIGILLAATAAIPGFTPARLIAGLGLGAVVVSFAFRDMLENFLAGVLIMLRDKMNIGDYVRAGEIEGIVEQITLRETHIRRFSGELNIVPNSMLFKNPVLVFSDRPSRRFEITVGVSYETDLALAGQTIRKALEEVEGISKERPVEVWARQFGGSSIDFLVLWWVSTPDNSPFRVQHETVLAIKRALDEAGIEFPLSGLGRPFPPPGPARPADRTPPP